MDEKAQAIKEKILEAARDKGLFDRLTDDEILEITDRKDLGVWPLLMLIFIMLQLEGRDGGDHHTTDKPNNPV